MSYLADPYAGLGPEQRARAGALADDNVANKALHDRLAGPINLVGKDFTGGAAKEGTKRFQEMVSAVDFPKFVSGLVEGVYTSIVNSSIRQMQAYGKLLEAVAKSVDQFAKENISENEAKQFIKNSFSGQIDLDSESGSLKLNEENQDAPAPDFKAVLQMQENLELTEENEKKIVLAAQMKMARQRQQTLAQMVAMGINRIIVTDGEIKASVLFDMKAHDTGQRGTFASTSDTKTDTESSGGGWFSDDSSVRTTVSSAYSQEQEKSTADLEVKAKLSGSVTVKFKSETFPLERLASSDELGAVQSKSGR